MRTPAMATSSRNELAATPNWRRATATCWPAEGRATRGSIHPTGEAGGTTRMETSNGSIVAEAQPPLEGRVSLVSSNGNIRAALPEQLKGTLDLSTSNGAVTTRLGAATLSHADWGKRRLTAQLNGGGGGQVVAR